MQPHRVELQLRFTDIDLAGHVNNAVYLNYFEQARLSFFAQFLGGDHDWMKEGVLLAHAELDYHDRIELNDKVYVEISCDRLGTKSFDFIYKVLRRTPDGPVRCCSGKTTMVCFDFKENATIAVPEKWRKALEA